ncbi:MAG: hypothetical protein JXQ96_23850 [Cyclobacteriaceae bacterium]
MTEEVQVTKSIELISSHFSIPQEELALSNNNFQSLEDKLTTVVSYLLDKDMNRLLNSLYRIDLNEQVFKKILVEETPENISRRLAREIIKRELEKVKTRAKYSGW